MKPADNLHMAPVPAGVHILDRHAPGQLPPAGREVFVTPAPPPSCQDAIPEKARRIALARVDLVRLWSGFRTEHNGSAAEIDREFLQLYESGHLADGILKILGKVSIKTLYRWKNLLDESNDWTLLVPQYFNRGRGPVLQPEEAKTFLSLLLQPNRIKIGAAIRLTKYALENKGMESPSSPMTFRRFAERFKKQYYDRWVLLREGQKALIDKVAPHIKRDPSLLEVGDVLVADGHRLNFQVINPFTGRPCRATLVGYLDWKSYDLAGYEIMVEENTQCIASALRNAIINLGLIPKVAYQDNGKAFRGRFFTGADLKECGIYGLFGRLGIVPVFAAPYNARAKIIERWFKEFSDTCERLMPSYTGSNINDKPAWMLRNEKFHKAVHNEFVPTIEEAVQMIEAWHNFHRSQPCPHVKGRTVGEVFDEGRGPGVDLSELDDLMMATELRNIRNNGIRFLNTEYYDENLYGYREKVIIKYSLFDLGQIKVYDIKGQFLCTAQRVEYTHPMAPVLGGADDITSVKNKVAQQRRLRKQTMNVARQYLKTKDQAPQLDWQKVAEHSPRVIDKIEKENITLPGDERQIPEEMVSDNSPRPPLNLRGGGSARDNSCLDSAGNEGVKMQSEQTTFAEAWQRYEHLKQQEEISEEDRQWLQEYMRSAEYRMLYGAREAAG